jgi:hypothetical protein
MEVNAMDVDEAEGGIETIAITMGIYDACELEYRLRGQNKRILMSLHKVLKDFLVENNVVRSPDKNI